MTNHPPLYTMRVSYNEGCVGMKNRYEIRGDDLIIFIDRKDGSVMETVTNKYMLPMLRRLDVKWCVMKDYTTKIEDKYYVKAEYEGTSILLHRVLMEAEKGELIDHEDHDRLNNRMRNLRRVSASLNSLNREGVEIRNTTGVRNVYFNGTKSLPYRVKIKYKGKHYFDRNYKTLEEATIVAEQVRLELMNKIS